MPERRTLDVALLALRLVLAGLLLGVILLGDPTVDREARIVLLAALLLAQVATAVFSPLSRGPHLRAEMLGSSVAAVAYGTQVVLGRNRTLGQIEAMAGGPVSLILLLGLIAAMVGLALGTYRLFRNRGSP